MNEWLQKQIDSGFSDFKGLSLTARIPVRDVIVNELIAKALTSPPAPAPPGGPNPRPFLKFVKKAEVHSTDGVITLDVDVRID
jgi:hypothetical protein